MEKFALVTPSYFPDLERCRLLVDSLERVGAPFSHYLIIDRRDERSFDSLRSDRTIILESESLIEKWLWRWPGGKSFWLSLRAPPVRGWIIQQILKIAAVQHIEEDILVFCDSDTCFIRPFSEDDFLIDGKVGLLDTDFTGGSVKPWTAVAARLLGLDTEAVTPRNHVGNLICWRRAAVLAMQARLREVTGGSWQLALARELQFSEYMLYGVFAREILGYGPSSHAPSIKPLVKASWGHGLSSEAELDRFFAEIPPETIAIMVHSKDGVSVERLRRKFENLWNEMDALRAP